MNHYSFDELQIGMKESFTVKITEEMMNSFMEITGDINPLHTDIGYANKGGYRDKVVYGMLTSSFLSTLAGVYLPGENSLIQSVEIKMSKPVYVGDTLSVSGKIIEKSDTFPVIVIQTSIKNQDSELVLRGRMQIGVRNNE